MKNLIALTKIPEVLGAALSDASGVLLDCVGQMDGETSGAVHAYAARALADAGNMLGLSTLERVTLTSGKATCLIAVVDGDIVGISVDPTKQLAMVEKKIWEAISK